MGWGVHVWPIRPGDTGDTGQRHSEVEARDLQRPRTSQRCPPLPARLAFLWDPGPFPGCRQRLWLSSGPGHSAPQTWSWLPPSGPRTSEARPQTLGRELWSA